MKTPRIFVMVLIVTHLSGCATNTPQIPDYFATKSLGPNTAIQRVVMVKVLAPPEIDAVDLGVTQGQAATSGAAEGALQALDLWSSGTCEGAVCGAWVLLLPAFVGIGALIGAVTGANSGYPPDVLKAAEANARARLQANYLQIKLLEQAQNYATNNTDLQFIHIPSADPNTMSEKPSYAMLSEDGFENVFELELKRLSFDWQRSGHRQPSLNMEARARLVSANTGAILSDGTYSFVSEARPLKEWAANGANTLTAAIEQGLQTLAEDIVDENFLLYYPTASFENDLKHSAKADGRRAKRSAVPSYVLEPYYPPLEHCFFCEEPFSKRPHRAIGNLAFVKVDSNQPAFRWEPFLGFDVETNRFSDVRYDIKVFEAGLASNNGLNLVPTQQVYNKRNITTPFHRIEKVLNPCTDYFWTVRARFKRFGRERVTEWAGAFNVYGWDEKPWNLRHGIRKYKDAPSFIPMIKPDGPEWFYYPFRTPCDQ